MDEMRHYPGASLEEQNGKENAPTSPIRLVGPEGLQAYEAVQQFERRLQDQLKRTGKEVQDTQSRLREVLLGQQQPLVWQKGPDGRKRLLPTPRLTQEQHMNVLFWQTALENAQSFAVSTVSPFKITINNEARIPVRTLGGGSPHVNSDSEGRLQVHPLDYEKGGSFCTVTPSVRKPDDQYSLASISVLVDAPPRRSTREDLEPLALDELAPIDSDEEVQGTVETAEVATDGDEADERVPVTFFPVIAYDIVEQRADGEDVAYRLFVVGGLYSEDGVPTAEDWRSCDPNRAGIVIEQNNQATFHPFEKMRHASGHQWF